MGVARPQEGPRYLPVSVVNSKYFTWLCKLVGIRYNGNQYKHLLKQLHNKNFYWFVPNDDNRAFEGRELRSKFCDDCNIIYDESQYDIETSMLELIMALAYRCESIMVDQDENIPMYDWFWRLISNVGLHIFTDKSFNNWYEDNKIEDILDIIINRTYSRKGEGGLFPLKKSRKDQRKVELWYQMSEYLVQNYYSDVTLL